MLAKKNGPQLEADADESETRNGITGSRATTPVLVWRQLSRWSWETECGRFRIERFIVGTHEGIRDDGYTWPDRFRALKRTAEWNFEFAPNEGSLAAAQQTCKESIT